MPVPGFGAFGVIPPFLGAPEESGQRSPYVATAREVVDALGTSLPRCQILKGWLAYRKELLKLNVDGFQWVAGSFCEDVAFRTPPRDPPEPGDVDIVTFVRPPPIDANAFLQKLAAHRQVWNPLAKQTFKCDAYFGTVINDHVDLQFATYWYGLFSHRRNDFQWKGLLRVDLASDDAAAAVALAEAESSLTPVVPEAVPEAVRDSR